MSGHRLLRLGRRGGHGVVGRWRLSVGAGPLISRFRLPLVLVLAAMAFGTIGNWLEGHNLLDAVYRTILTLSTVGVGTPEPEGVFAKLFTISLILFGVVAAFTAIGVITSIVASGELSTWIRRRYLARRVDRLEGHYVVCAYGRVGRAVIDELRRHGTPSVVIESKPDLAPPDESDLAFVLGDSTDEAVLRSAGIERARGLICAVDSDAANVFITLTARAINPGLRIIARAAEAASVDKLTRAGADEVVSPYRLSGRRMAVLCLQPSVLEMLDLLNLGPDIRLEEVVVRPESQLAGRTIGDALSRHTGVAILALKQPGSDVIANPDRDTQLAPDDIIMAIGPVTLLNSMAQ